MTRRSTGRAVRAIADIMWRRDRLQMRAIDAVATRLTRRRPGAGAPSPGAPHSLPARQRGWAGFRSVLCPIDFSDPSRLALRYAQAIAQRSHGALTALYVNDPLLVAAAAAALHDRRIAERSAVELRQFVDSTLGSGSGRTRVVSRVASGDPTREILRAAARGRSDLIVLGSHGLTGADRLLIGSTTLGVLRRTTVPVLAVPRPATGTRARVPAAWPGRRIIAAIELDGTPEGEVETAFRLAEWFDASLLLVHVVAEVAAPSWLRLHVSAEGRRRVARARRQLEALAAGVGRGIRIAARVVRGRVPDEIAAIAASEQAGLIVTALRDRARWFSPARGAVSYQILAKAAAPVLAYPPSWRPR